MNAMFTHRLVNRCHSKANMSLIRFNIIISDAVWIDINITPRGLRCFLHLVVWNFLMKKIYSYYLPSRHSLGTLRIVIDLCGLGELIS